MGSCICTVILITVSVVLSLTTSVYAGKSSHLRKLSVLIFRAKYTRCSSYPHCGSNMHNLCFIYTFKKKASDAKYLFVPFSIYYTQPLFPLKSAVVSCLVFSIYTLLWQVKLNVNILFLVRDVQVRDYGILLICLLTSCKIYAQYKRLVLLL